MKARCAKPSDIACFAALLYILCLCRAARCLDPQSSPTQYLRQRWTTSNGFPGGRINALVQTTDGYLWVGTSKGLSRYDGFTYVPFGKISEAGSNLTQALSLVAGRDGSLWILDQDLNVQRFSKGKLEDVGDLQDRQRGTVSAIAPSDDGGILLATQAPRLFEVRQSRSVALTGDGNLGIPSPQKLVRSTDGKIWMATYEAGLFVWDSHHLASMKKSVPDKINCMLPVTGGSLWIGTDEGLVLWNGHEITSRYSSRDLEGTRVMSLSQDRDSNLWIGTSNGLFRLNRSGLQLIESGPKNKPQTITALAEDREGNLWVGDAEGIERFSDGMFKTYSAPSGLPKEGTGPVYVDGSSQAWVAPSHGGLYRIANGKTVAVATDELGRDVIYSIAGSENDLWVGRRDGGLTHLVSSSELDLGARPVKTYTKAQGLAQNSITSVFCSSDKTVWAGTLSGGVSHLVENRARTLTAADGLGSNTIFSIQQSLDGALWFATSDGLSSFTNGRIKTYRIRDGLPSNEVTTLFEDEAGVLWIGTAQGLAYMVRGHIVPVDDAHPTLHEPIYGIASDKRGHLWLTTSNHVLRVNRTAMVESYAAEGDYRDLGVEDGLPGVEGVRRDRSVAADRNGHVWLSTTSGFSMVRQTQMLDDLAPTRPVVSSIWSDGTQVALDGPVRIGPAPQRILVNYEAVSLAVPNRVRYRYKLDGFDRNWSEPTETRQVVYTNLGPGRYRFGVLTSEGGGFWKGSDSVISFVIQPTLQQTCWFKVVCVCAIAAALWALYLLRLKQATARLKEQLDARLEERERVARDLHDTLLQGFQGLVLRFQGVLKMMPEGTGKDSMERTLQRADDVMIEARESVKGLRGRNSQDDFQSLLASCGEELAEGSPHQFRIVVLGTTRALHPTVVQESYKILREALLNAFQHSEGSQIELELTYTAARLAISVRDDGRGMDEALIRRGRTNHWGITGMRERANNIGAELTILSRIGSGTEVRLILAGSVSYLEPRQSPWWKLKKAARASNRG